MRTYYSKRSKRGKRRLAIVGIIGGIFLSCIVVCFLPKKDVIDELVTEYGKDVMDITLAPTLAVKSEVDKHAGSGVEEDVELGYRYKYEAAALQKEILAMVGNGRYSYGTEHRDGRLTAQGFSEAFYDAYGKSVELEEVGVGDVGVGAGYTGICVGFDEGVPVFAYAAEHSMYDVGYAGVCLGYLWDMKDAAYCGMYPVRFTSFYDCCNTIGDNQLLLSKKESLYADMKARDMWYSDLLYEYGRMVSGECVEDLIAMMPRGDMQQCDVTVVKEDFERFLKSFPDEQGCPGEEYSFEVLKEINNSDKMVSLQVVCISMEEASYLKTYGEWPITVYRTNEVAPCTADLNSYIGICGFAPAHEITITETEKGEVVIEKEELIYGYTIDENGRPIIRAWDGSILYLDTEVPAEPITEGDEEIVW